jgi:hypothetical protein
MMERSDLSSSNRTLSASSLKDRLSKLSVTPLRPVAALQARVESVHSCCLFFWPPHRSIHLPLLCLQFCPSEHSSGAPAPDGHRCVMDKHDADLRLPDPIPPVRAFLCPSSAQLTSGGGMQVVPPAVAFHDRVHHLGLYRPGT